MQLDVLAPEVWRREVDAALAGAADPVRRSAWVALRTAHDHHVGLTPSVAREFAELMPIPGGGSAAAGTDGALARYLVAALDAARGGSGTAPAERSRRLWPWLPHALVLRSVVLPAAASVDRALGRTMLFADAGSPLPAATADAWRSHAAAFDERFRDQLAHWRDDRAGVTRLIQGFTLLGAVQRRLRSGDAGSAPAAARGGSGAPALPLPSPEEALVAMLVTASPSVPAALNRLRPPRPARRSSTQDRQAERPREEGVIGLRLARTIDEIDGMVLSEHLNPPAIKLDRLLTTQFMIHHRPPRRVPPRTVLVAGLAPRGLSGRTAAITKAAWAEAMLRLSRVLWRADCLASDLRWVEARADGLSVGGHSLDRDGPPPAVGDDRVRRADLIRFVALHGWLPDFVDRRANRPLPPAPRPTAADRDGLVRPVADRLRALMAAAPAGLDIGAGDAEDYAIVHAVCLYPHPRPGDIPATAVRDALARARAGLGLQHRPRPSVSLTVIPTGDEEVDTWIHADDRHGVRAVVDADRLAEARRRGESPADLVMGGLIERWMLSAQEAFARAG